MGDGRGMHDMHMYGMRPNHLNYGRGGASGENRRSRVEQERMTEREDTEYRIPQ